MDNEGKMGRLRKALQERGEAVFMCLPEEVRETWRWMLDDDVIGGEEDEKMEDDETRSVVRRYWVMSIPGTPRLRDDRLLEGLLRMDDCDWESSKVVARASLNFL